MDDPGIIQRYWIAYAERELTHAQLNERQFMFLRHTFFMGADAVLRIIAADDDESDTWKKVLKEMEEHLS